MNRSGKKVESSTSTHHTAKKALSSPIIREAYEETILDLRKQCADLIAKFNHSAKTSLSIPAMPDDTKENHTLREKLLLLKADAENELELGLQLIKENSKALKKADKGDASIQNQDRSKIANLYRDVTHQLTAIMDEYTAITIQFANDAQIFTDANNKKRIAEFKKEAAPTVKKFLQDYDDAMGEYDLLELNKKNITKIHDQFFKSASRQLD